jgi:hypothetical protein
VNVFQVKGVTGSCWLGSYTCGMAGGLRPTAARLLERGEELARIEQAISALQQGHAGVMVIQGAAGIGKSALLQALCERAMEAGVQTLTARSSELERDFGFGIVRQLLEVQLVRARESERAELLSGAAGLAAPVLGLGGMWGIRLLRCTGCTG